MKPKTLDHVALWVANPDALADRLTRDFGMHVIERTERFTLVGSDARRGKLTLFAADGPREPGALKHVALRVSNLAAANGNLPAGTRVPLALRDGLVIDLVEAPTDVEYDLDHVALYSRTPRKTAEAYVGLGFRPADPGPSGAPRVEVGGAYVELHAGDPGKPERPLLNHVGVLVDSAEDHRAEAEQLGVEVADFVDAANTVAVFVWGPERVKLEYVEHKPTFALR